MSSPDLIIRGRKVVLPDSIGAQSIHIRDGVIESLRGYDEIAGDCALVEADETSIIMPGLVDTHVRSEEHTSELQSRLHLVCRLLLEKKKNSSRPKLSCGHEHRRRPRASE